MFSFLLYGFDGNYELVKKLLTPGSHLFSCAEDAPPHPVIQDVNAMNVDGEEELPSADITHDMERIMAEYGEVNVQTQNF